MSIKKTGVLLVNLGTPDSPKVSDVKKYLREFLNDGRVINNDKGKVTNFTFEKLDFNLSKYESKTTTYPKIQEASSKDLFNCIYYDYVNKREIFKAKYLSLLFFL